MKWELTQDPLGRKSLRVEWHDYDFIRLELDNVDLQLLRECDQSRSLSDILLGLEMLARKLEASEKVGVR
jgi:hypothetical protein